MSCVICCIDIRRASFMNKFNTQALIRDFPRLYRLARSGSKEPMLYGFQCSDGWFQVIYSLSSKIEERATAAGLDPVSEHWPSFAQVKEKFGELRVYLACQSARCFCQRSA